MSTITRSKLLAAVAASAVIAGGAVALTSGSPADERALPTMTAQEICDAKPILVSCDQIDELPPGKRAALVEDAQSFLKGRTPAQAQRELEADLKKLREEHPIEMIGDRDSSTGFRAGDITDEATIRIPGFTKKNAWLVPNRLIGGHKNDITVYVGAASDDPTQGMLARVAYGDTVPGPSGAVLTASPLPGNHGAGAHIAAADNDTGIVTIEFADHSTIRYDGIEGRFR